MYFQLLVNHLYGWNMIDFLWMDKRGAYFSVMIKRRPSSTQIIINWNIHCSGELCSCAELFNQFVKAWLSNSVYFSGTRGNNNSCYITIPPVEILPCGTIPIAYVLCRNYISYTNEIQRIGIFCARIKLLAYGYSIIVQMVACKMIYFS